MKNFNKSRNNTELNDVINGLYNTYLKPICAKIKPGVKSQDIFFEKSFLSLTFICISQLFICFATIPICTAKHPKIRMIF